MIIILAFISGQSFSFSNELLTDDEVEELVDETISSYQIPKKNKKGKAGFAALPLEAYASLFLRDPFLQPNTPVGALRKLKQSTIDVKLSGCFSEKSFGSSSNRESLASRVFGKKDIRVEDFVLVSRLAEKGGIVQDLALPALPNNDDFAAISKELVEFGALTHKEEVVLNLDFGFFEKRLRLTAALPFCVASNQLRIQNDGSLFTKVLDHSGRRLTGDFKDQSLSQFVDAATSGMGMRVGERVSAYGVGQGSVGLAYSFPVESLEYCSFGIQLYLPTAPKPDADRVWPVELAPRNWALGIHGTLLHNKNRYCNPYVFVDGRLNFSNRESRRVSRIVDGEGVASPAMKMALGGFVQWAGGGNNFMNEQESSIRGFSDFSSDLRWQLGHKIDFQIGNIFEQVIGKAGFFDIAYSLGIKAADSAIDVSQRGKYDLSVFEKNSAEIAHKCLLSYGYHFTDSFRLNVAASFVFAGRNTPQVVGSSLLFSFGF